MCKYDSHNTIIKLVKRFYRALVAVRMIVPIRHHYTISQELDSHVGIIYKLVLNFVLKITILVGALLNQSQHRWLWQEVKLKLNTGWTLSEKGWCFETLDLNINIDTKIHWHTEAHVQCKTCNNEYIEKDN